MLVRINKDTEEAEVIAELDDAIGKNEDEGTMHVVFRNEKETYFANLPFSLVRRLAKFMAKIDTKKNGGPF